MINPSVSVLVPTYNGTAHLKECLDSIRDQSFRDFEVVICDDQSTDGTLDLARELAAGDDRFRFIQNPRRFGLVGNWNNCVEVSRGEWVKFVFQDDLIAPTCVEMLLAACESTGKHFGFCSRDFIFEPGTTQEFQEWLLGQRAMVEAMYFGHRAIDADEAGRAALENRENLVGEPTVTLIRRRVFEEFGVFDSSLIQLCDAEYWFRAMSNLGAAWVPERLATFRVHEKAASSTNRSTRLFRAKVLDRLVVHYRLAFDPRFARLRAAKLPGRSTRGLRKELAVAAFEAWSQAKLISNSDETVMKEWRTVAASCTGLPALRGVGQAIIGFRSAKGAAKRLIGLRGSETSK